VTYFLPAQEVSLTIFAAVTKEAEATMRDERDENNIFFLTISLLGVVDDDEKSQERPQKREA